MHPYQDLLEASPPKSKRHTPMSRENRAAQFAPFAALVGYEESLKKEAKKPHEAGCTNPTPTRSNASI